MPLFDTWETDTGYIQWVSARFLAINAWMGSPEWPRGKRILELGCMAGVMGRWMQQCGADVTFCDGRQQWLDVVKEIDPDAKVELADLNREWPFDGQRFDLVLHMGLLYHLSDPMFSLLHALAAGEKVVVETQVVDQDHEALITFDEDVGDDQSLDGGACQPTIRWVELVLRSAGRTGVRATPPTVGIHTYKWDQQGKQHYMPGKRAMWLVD